MEKPKLLLADDSATIQRVVNLTFADEGFDVVTVGDGDSALREIANAQPDIVLADVHMPGPSGFEICSFLRGIEETAAMPVILLVGQFEQFDPAEAERSGADAFITKPFQSIRQVVEQVKELVSKKQQPEPPALEATQIPDKPDIVPPEKDTSDIDSLYAQSFPEPGGVTVETGSSAYASDRIDDEMIETSYGFGASFEPLAYEPEGEQTISHAPFPEVGGEGSNVADLETVPLSLDNLPSPSYEETLQMDVPPLIDAGTGPSVHGAPTEELRRDAFATTTDAFDLDDIDLLNLTTDQVDERYSFGTPVQTVESGAHKQVVSISPELLEIIVQKVVEKLSEKY